MNTILDQSNDMNGQHLYRLISLYEVPEFVKEASVSDICEPEYPTLGLFADPKNLKYPTHTKAATYVSALFFWDQGIKDPNIERTLEKRASFHGILGDYKALVKQHRDTMLVKTAEDSSTYPVRNEAEVKAACEYMKKYEDRIPYLHRKELSQRILEKSAELGVSVDTEYLNKQAGYGVCSSEDAYNLIKSRELLLKYQRRAPEVRDELCKIAEACKENPEEVRGRKNLVKLAEILDNIDRSCSLTKHYGKDLDKPEDVLFAVTEKIAEDLVNGSCNSITGNTYKIADFNKVNLEDIRDVFGDDFADSVSSGGLMINPEKLAEQIPSLPRPDAELLDRILVGVGIEPIFKQAAENKSPWFSREFLRNLATERAGDRKCPTSKSRSEN